MKRYAAFLRGVSPMNCKMPELARAFEAAGFADVATYIQSGNVVFTSKRGEASVKKLLAAALAEHLGRPYGVLVRSADELRELLDANPFPKAAPNQLLMLFLDEKPAAAKLKDVVAPGGEELRACGRHVFIHFPNGMGRSKLKLPFRDVGTGRNLNTVRKLLAMLEAM